MRKTEKRYKIIPAILSLPKTIYFNFKVFPWRQAVKLPVIIHYKTKVYKCSRGCVELPENAGFGLIKLGFGGTKQIIHQPYNVLYLEKGSKLIFHGKANVGEGFSISNEGKLELGKDLWLNKNAKLFCSHNVRLGDEVVVG